VNAWFFLAIVVPKLSTPSVLVLSAVQLPWMLIWLWGLHGFLHQVVSAFDPVLSLPVARACSAKPVAILYTTCDDFDAYACRSLLLQDFRHTRLIICDDSTEQSSRDRIDEWVRVAGAKVVIVRRNNRQGFKAGNLNFALSTVVHEDIFVLCDADQVLPPSFVGKAIQVLEASGVGFVQCGNAARSPGATWLSEALGPAVDIFYQFALPSRNRYGFVSCFGHAAIVRRDAWQAAGRFPEVVTEDLAFAMMALAQGYQGRFSANPSGEESFPQTYSALKQKYIRIVAGTVESLRRYGPTLLRSPRASWVEKLDAFLTFSTCYLPVIILMSVAGGMVFSHLAGGSGYVKVQGWLLALYLVGPQTPILALLKRAFAEPKRYLRFVVVASVVYSSLVPSLAWTAIRQTFLSPGCSFVPTGAAAKVPERLLSHARTIAAGLMLIGFAAVVGSPVLVPTVVFGLMIAIGPLQTLSAGVTASGSLVRWSVLVPYAVLVSGLLMEW
jgi:hypothetical protein